MTLNKKIVTGAMAGCTGRTMARDDEIGPARVH
jgi:hypothetical protein